MRWMQSDPRDWQARRGGRPAVGRAARARKSAAYKTCVGVGTGCVRADDECASIRDGTGAVRRAVASDRRRGFSVRRVRASVDHRSRGKKGVMEKMRHVRILGLSLVAVFALSAATAVPALATKYTDETYGQFKNCPFSNPKVEECVAGITSGGKSGGFFQYGKVEVPLSKSITLQGGVFGDETAPGAETSALGFVGPNNGAEAVVSPELPVRSGLKLITPEVQKDNEWPQALTESFNEAVKNKETGMFVQIEVAGNGLYENPKTHSTPNTCSKVKRVRLSCL